MTVYRTCAGCIVEGQPCERRDALKKAIQGLGITSAKFKCQDRRDRYASGDPVWARLFAGYGDEEARYDTFSGVVISCDGTRAFVFVMPGTLGLYTQLPFKTYNHGFCHVSLKRISQREGDQQEICEACQRPSEYGHAEGYACSLAEQIAGGGGA